MCAALMWDRSIRVILEDLEVNVNAKAGQFCLDTLLTPGG